MLEACDEAVGERWRRRCSASLDQEEREALYHGLVASVRALHAGLPEQLIIR